MPLYDYKCTKCGHIFEVQQKMSEEALKYCPVCKGPIKRLISAAGIIFKGSGFHVNDYGKKEVKETKAKEKTPAKPAETKKESNPTVVKPKSSES
ncbi:MAG: zinc ribbon domain-containing protein [Candidatus Margulisbacteria bacterium]|nr:zinc ribbon domain-containing protein [Candidatus Margulisiibacteriota bacterium]